MNNEIKLSVLLPVYNGEKYLNDSIESILAQSFEDFEFLIINDGSIDGSKEIIKKYNDPRIIYVENDRNLGLIQTLNKGLNLARGEYVARMDQDDISLKKRFEVQIGFMDNNPEFGVCGSWIKTFGDTKSKIVKYPNNPELIRAQLLFSNPLAHPTVIMRLNLLKKNNLFYRDDFKNSEDYDLWTRAEKSFKIYNIPKVLLKYRISSEQMTQKHQASQNEMMKLIRLKYLEPFSKHLNNQDILLFQEIGSYNSPNSTDFIDESMNLLLKFININKINKIYNEKIFSRVVAGAYFNLLAKNINLGIFVLKRLLFSRIGCNIGTKDKVKFIIKFIYYGIKRIVKNF